MKNLKPIFIENSRVPSWVSKITTIKPCPHARRGHASKVPTIKLWAISFFIFVFCAGKLDARVRRHETIHFQQQLEMLFVLHWLLYGCFWLVGYIKYRNATIAYFKNPFEQEAYAGEQVENYLAKRTRYSWFKYKI